MLRPTLFVGCGGSGLRTLRRLRRQLEYRLQLAGVSRSEFPAAWQFLVVDVPSEEQGDTFLAPYAHNSYVGLAPTGTGYQAENGIDHQLATRVTSQGDFAQWRPDPAKVFIDPRTGAGQYRAVGRVIGAFALDRAFMGRLSGAIALMEQDGARQQLRSVAERLHIPDATSGPIPDPVAVLVSSLGGGAGSGIFMDVADSMRLLSSNERLWLQKSVGILYDPSTFYSQDDWERGGIPPNTLAAVSELVAGRWKPWPEVPYLAGRGAPLGVARGPEYSLLFGTSNGVLTLPNGDAVYETVANILSSLTLSPTVSGSFFERLSGNWSKNSAMAKDAPVVEAQEITRGNRPLSSVGFARVSLGRDRFGLYATERLARMITERVMTLHVTDETRLGLKTVEQAVGERIGAVGETAGVLVTDFLERAGLNEGSTEHNQVIDALLPASEVLPIVDAVKAHVLGQLRDPKAVASQFEYALYNSGQIERTESGVLLPVVQSLLLRNAERWAGSIQGRVLDAVASLVATEGIRVASEVVRRAGELEIGKRFPSELRAEATMGINSANATWQRLLASLASSKLGRRGVPGTVKDKFGELVQAQVEALAGRQVRLVAAVLLEDMATNMFRPLTVAMAVASDSLSSQMGGSEFRALSSEAVPVALEPPKNEKLIEPIESYPKMYLDLLNRTVASEVEAGVRAFAGEIGEPAARHLLDEDLRSWRAAQPWVPDLAAANRAVAGALGTPGQVPSPLRVEFSVTLDAVKQRCLAWMQADGSSPIGEHLKEHLNEYLDPGTPAEQMRRVELVARLFNDAFDMAKPFTALNTSWLAAKYGYEVSYNFELSDIPFSPAGHKDAVKLLDQAMSAEIPDPLARAEKFNGSYEGDIEIYSWLNPFSASGAQSLTQPIVTALNAELRSSSDGDAGEFWHFRRARPLGEFIPLPRASQVAITRGWITARLFDALEFDATGCTVTHEGIRSRVLSPPLEPCATAWDWLAVTLESVLLAEMLAAGNEPGPLAACDMLIKMGSPNNELKVSTNYDFRNPSFDWSNPPGLAYFDGSLDADTALESLVASFGTFVAEGSVGFKPVPLRVQIAHLVTEAARQMLSSASQPVRVPGE